MNKAQLYTRSNVLQRRDAEAVLQEFGHMFHAGDWQSRPGVQERLLDIGTGSGDVLVDFLMPLFGEHSACQFVGTDISEDMVRFGSQHYAARHANLSFQQLDILGDVLAFLRTQDGRRFKYVTSFYCLHWVQNQLLAMRNVHRLLQPHGQCLLAFIGHMAIFEIYQRMARSRKWAKFMSDVDQFVSPYQDEEDPAATARDTMQAAGFQRVLVQSKKLTFHYTGIPSLRKAVRAVNPFIRRMVAEDQEDFLDDYVAHTRRMGLWENPDDNEEQVRVRVDYTLLVVAASK